jgi:hypothetical protein
VGALRGSVIVYRSFDGAKVTLWRAHHWFASRLARTTPAHAVIVGCVVTSQAQMEIGIATATAMTIHAPADKSVVRTDSVSMWWGDWIRRERLYAMG